MPAVFSGISGSAVPSSAIVSGFKREFASSGDGRSEGESLRGRESSAAGTYGLPAHHEDNQSTVLLRAIATTAGGREAGWLGGAAV